LDIFIKFGIGIFRDNRADKTECLFGVVPYDTI